MLFKKFAVQFHSTKLKTTILRLDFCQRENQLLKDGTMAKQRAIETILSQNNELLN